MASGSGTREDPWALTTAPGTSAYQMWRDEAPIHRRSSARSAGRSSGTTLRCIDDLHAMLKAHGDWMPLGGADEQKPAPEGTVEAWGRSPDNPVGGWYGLKKGLRGRFGVYLPPLLEALGLAELTHDAKNNRMRAHLMPLARRCGPDASARRRPVRGARRPEPARDRGAAARRASVRSSSSPTRSRSVGPPSRATSGSFGRPGSSSRNRAGPAGSTGSTTRCRGRSRVSRAGLGGRGRPVPVRRGEHDAARAPVPAPSPRERHPASPPRSHTPR